MNKLIPVILSLILSLTAWGQGLPSEMLPGQTALDLPPAAMQDTIAVIVDPDLTPDDIYGDGAVMLPAALLPEDFTTRTQWGQWVAPAATFALSALFVDTPKLVQARHWVQGKLAKTPGANHTAVDNYLQYVPVIANIGLGLCGVKAEHNFIDRTLISAIAYATFAVVNNGAKYAFREQRPNCLTRNSFPSGHTGTAFVGAELLRREYWHTNRLLALGGYLFGIATGYLRIYNNRHWINDIVGGAALGYLSTTFAYWIFPKLFQRRALAHRQRLLQRLPSAPPVQVVAVPAISTDHLGLNAAIIF